MKKAVRIEERKGINGKDCNVCGEWKSLLEYDKRKEGLGGRRGTCKVCRKETCKKQPQKKISFTKKCATCHKSFLSPNSNTKYCSAKCYGETLKIRITVSCSHCSVKFERQPCFAATENLFCSKECLNAHRKVSSLGSKNPSYRGGKQKTACDGCGSVYERRIYPSEINRRTKFYCSKECKTKYDAKRFKGKNNPRWNEELTSDERITRRHYPEYYNWRNSVFNRDEHSCACCGDDTGGNLNAHHLDGYNWAVEKRTLVENGITMCDECHSSFHKDYGYGDNTREQFFEWFEANRQRFELSQERFDNLIAWLASANAMSVEEYRDYVYWCHANPRSIENCNNL